MSNKLWEYPRKLLSNLKITQKIPENFPQVPVNSPEIPLEDYDDSQEPITESQPVARGLQRFLTIKTTPYSIILIKPSDINSNSKNLDFIRNLYHICSNHQKPIKIVDGTLKDFFTVANKHVSLELRKTIERHPIWWELYFENGSVNFYLHVPTEKAKHTISMLHRTWKQCRATIITSDYLPEWDRKTTEWVSMNLAKHNSLSLSTDRLTFPLKSLLQAFRGLDNSDKALFQLGIMYDPNFNANISHVIPKLKSGIVPKRPGQYSAKDFWRTLLWIIGVVIEEILNIVMELVTFGKRKEEMREIWNSRHETVSKFSQETLSKPYAHGFNTNLRVVISSSNPSTRETFLKSVGASLQEMQEDNYWVPKKEKFKKISLVNSRKLYKKHRNVTSEHELAKMIALPDADMQRENTDTIKTVVADRVQPSKGLFNPDQAIPVGFHRDQNDQQVPVYMPYRNIEAFIKSKYAIGETRSGKSTFGVNFTVEMFRRGMGSCFIESADGKTIRDILSVLTPQEREKVAVLDFTNVDYYIGLVFNELLRNPKMVEENLEAVSRELIYFFEVISTDKLNMRARRWIKNAINAVITRPDANILDIQLMMTDDKYREKVLKNVTDPFIKKAWEVSWKGLSTGVRNNILTECFNRLDFIIQHKHIRRTIMQRPKLLPDGRFALELDRMMDEGWLVLVQLPARDIDMTNAVGSLLVSKIFLTALTRDTSARAFHLTIDEPHKVIKSADRLRRMIVECAKHRVSFMALIHEWSQMEEIDAHLANTLINNAGHCFYFSTGTNNFKRAAEKLHPYDAELFAREIRPHECLAVIKSIDSDQEVPRPIKIKGLPPIQERYPTTPFDDILKRDLERYGKPVEVIDNEIFNELQNAEDLSELGDEPQERVS